MCDTHIYKTSKEELDVNMFQSLPIYSYNNLGIKFSNKTSMNNLFPQNLAKQCVHAIDRTVKINWISFNFKPDHYHALASKIAAIMSCKIFKSMRYLGEPMTMAITTKCTK